jgi:putative hydrolase of the HAD superfamily
VKHIFFDLDRTLWDFERNSKQALNMLFEQHKLGDHMKSFESFHHAYKNINAKLWVKYGKGQISKEELRTRRFNETLKQFQINNEKLAEEIGMGYIQISPYQTNVFPNTHDTLEYLKNNDYVLHIITNGFKEVQFIKLEKSGLLKYFDIIVCSEDVGVNKPAPNVFHYSLEKANAKANESVMIGDDFKVDVLGAENVGMTGVLFDPHKGYKEGIHEWHIDDLEHIPGIIPRISITKL